MEQTALKDVNMKEKNFEMQFELFQPWSTFVMKTQLPPEILQKMLKITDEIIANTESMKRGESGGGQQFEDEFLIEFEILERENVMGFFLDVARNFVIQQTLQSQPFAGMRKQILNEEWYTKMNSMWIVSMKDNEYQPIHAHKDCNISAVMYLKIPEYLPSRNPNQNDDGSIVFTNFTNNTSAHMNQTPFSLTLPPQVGDFFIFSAEQLHQVYPFRTEDGKGERRSISFNASFTSKTEQDTLRKQQEEQDTLRKQQEEQEAIRSKVTKWNPQQP